MRRLLIPLLALPLLAASPPPRGLSLTVPDPGSSLLPLIPPPLPPAADLRYAPAPQPNRDVDAPLGPRASTSATVAPSLITRRDQFRGDGYNFGSSAQTEQERRVKPGAGLNLRVPLTGE